MFDQRLNTPVLRDVTIILLITIIIEIPLLNQSDMHLIPLIIHRWETINFLIHSLICLQQKF